MPFAEESRFYEKDPRTSLLAASSLVIRKGRPCRAPAVWDRGADRARNGCDDKQEWNRLRRFLESMLRHGRPRRINVSQRAPSKPFFKPALSCSLSRVRTRLSVSA